MKIQFKDKIIEVEKGKTIEEAFKDEIEKSKYTVIGAIYNNEYMCLNKKIDEDGTIELLDISSKEGLRAYRRTLIFIFAKALREIFPDNRATVNYQMANAIYCDIGDIEVTEEIVKELNTKMKEIVEKDLPITLITMNRDEAEKFFKEHNTKRGLLQFELKSNQKIYMNFCEDYFNYCYGIIANRTGITKIFEILKYDKGLLIRYPSMDRPDKLPKLILISSQLNYLGTSCSLHSLIG